MRNDVLNLVMGKQKMNFLKDGWWLILILMTNQVIIVVVVKNSTVFTIAKSTLNLIKKWIY